MIEVIEVLALNQAKTKLKLDSLKASKFDQVIVIEHLESLIKDYDTAINILTNYQGGTNRTETIKT